MSDSQTIINCIESYLKKNDLTYSLDREKKVFKYGTSLSSKLKNVSCIILVNDDDYLVKTISPLGAKDCLSEMAEFVCRATYGLRNGNFDLDFRDGEISYKSFVDCTDQIPGNGIIENSILIPIMMMERYGDGIVSVIFGIQSPKDAVEACEKKE